MKECGTIELELEETGVSLSDCKINQLTRVEENYRRESLKSDKEKTRYILGSLNLGIMPERHYSPGE